jgi:hypothetical protein
LPPALDAVFEMALAKDPAERPATAHELVQRLRDAFESEREPPTPTKVIVVPPAGRSMRKLVRRDHRARRPRLAVLAGALVLIVAGLGVAALVDAGDGFGPDKSGRSAASTQTTSSQSATTEQTTTEQAPEPTVDGVALNRDGFAKMQAGDFSGALPLLRQSVLALKGANTLDEAYADYNLAYTRFTLGRCDGVTGLLARSERIQGDRSEIDELRRHWEERCGSSDEQAAPGHGGGKDKGKGKGHDG